MDLTWMHLVVIRVLEKLHVKKRLKPSSDRDEGKKLKLKFVPCEIETTL